MKKSPSYNLYPTLNKGFTLLELLVVISIIGILMAVALASFTNAQIKARDTRRIGDMKAFQTVYEQYYSVNGAYAARTTMDDGFSGGAEPTESQPNHAAYNVSVTTTSPQSYCVCATVENTASGNSTVSNCSAFGGGGATTYYCVRNLQ